MINDYAELLDRTYDAARKLFPPHVAHAICTLADFAMLSRLFCSHNDELAGKIGTLTRKLNDALKKEIRESGGIEAIAIILAIISVLMNALLSYYIQEESEANNGYA
ncbi:MAG: hypothetical protein ACXQTZ_00435 [Candidatus Alkanophagales archaeon]